MAGLLSYIPIVNRLVGSNPTSNEIRLPPVEIHRIETNPDRRARCLKHLLKANHVNHSVVYHNLQFDNHAPHHLSSAYLLGASEAQMHKIFASESQQLEAWTPSPSEVMDEDWRDFLGNKEYQRAYVDYFEDKLAMDFSYNWRDEMSHFLFSGKQPLFHGLIGGLGHPLIHLGYAYEMESKDIAMEALTLSSVQYNFFHKYLDNASYAKQSPAKAASPLELLVEMSKDTRFDKIGEPSFDELEDVFDKHESLIMEYWNGWEITDAKKQFELSQEAAVALLVATVKPGTHAYNFLIVHLLTTSHAVRILLPFFPAKHHVALVREWWLLVIAVFIMKGRPLPDPDNVEENPKRKQWDYVVDRAVNGQWATDAHFVKGRFSSTNRFGGAMYADITAAVRAMREAARTWGDVHERYLSAAVTFVDNFHGWTF